MTAKAAAEKKVEREGIIVEALRRMRQEIAGIVGGAMLVTSLTATGSITAGGGFFGNLTGNASSASVASALASTVTLWGQNFNGANNVVGSLEDVVDITMSGHLSASTIETIGNVGIGVAPTTARLEVRGATADSSLNAFVVRDSGASALFSIRNDGRIDGIGPMHLTGLATMTFATNTQVLHLTNTNSTTGEILLATRTSDTASQGASWIGRRSKTTGATVVNNDVLAGIYGQGHDGTSFYNVNVGAIRILAAETHTLAARGSKIDFATTTIGSLTRTTRGTITDTGLLSWVGDATFGAAVTSQLAAAVDGSAPATFLARSTTNSSGWTLDAAWGRYGFWSNDASGLGSALRAAVDAFTVDATGATTGVRIVTSTSSALVTAAEFRHNAINLYLGPTISATTLMYPGTGIRTILRMRDFDATIDQRTWDWRTTTGGALELRSTTDGGTTVLHHLTFAHAGGITVNTGNTLTVPSGAGFVFNGTTAFFGTSVASSGPPKVDIAGGTTGIQLVVADITTDAAQKVGRIGSRHYTNAEEPMTIFQSIASVSDNTLNIGGGTSVMNAATTVSIFTGATNTTTTGTVRASWGPTGQFTQSYVSRFNAPMAFNTTPGATNYLTIGTSSLVTGSTSGRGLMVQAVAQSDVTAAYDAGYFQVRTAAAAFTLTDAVGVRIAATNLGAASAITNNYGLLIESLGVGTNRYAISTGTGLVNFGDVTTITTTTANQLAVRYNSSGVHMTVSVASDGATTFDASGTAPSFIFVDALTASPANANVVFSPTGTGVVTIAPASTGTLDNMTIGATTARAGTFTTIGSPAITGITSITTTGTLTISGTGETLATFVDDGAVTLYHNNTARLATTASGTTFTGDTYLFGTTDSNHSVFIGAGNAGRTANLFFRASTTSIAGIYLASGSGPTGRWAIEKLASTIFSEAIQIRALDDAGATIDTPLYIVRAANGAIILGGNTGAGTLGARQVIIDGTGYGAGVASLRLNGLTSGAAAAAGTLLNAPAAGDPAFWIPINIAGTVRYIPAW